MTKFRLAGVLSILFALTIAFIFIVTTENSVQNKVETLPIPTQSIQITDLSTLENSLDGYKFSYPFGWKVVYTDAGLEIIPLTKKGKILVNFDGQEIKITTDIKDLNLSEIEEIDKAADTIRNSFEITQQVELNKEETKKRFTSSQK